MKSLSTEDMPALSYITFYLQVDDPQGALDSSVPVGWKAIVRPMEKVYGKGSISAEGGLAEELLGSIKVSQNGTDS